MIIPLIGGGGWWGLQTADIIRKFNFCEGNTENGLIGFWLNQKMESGYQSFTSL